tara:strand:+ start:387 stop:506 length:120 start_codon:yes stop_codon:yes gene_type:complete
VNSAKDFVQGRRLIEARVAADGQDLADASRPLKDFLPLG